MVNNLSLKKKRISIIAPIFNEYETIPALVQRLAETASKREDLDWEFIFVNDGSKDGSRELLGECASKDSRIKIVHLSRNFGHQLAVTAGLDAVRSDIVAIIDADLQDPPEVLLEMIKEVESGYNMVYGTRKMRQGESWFKLLTARVFYRLLEKMTSVPIPLDTGDFRVMDAKVLTALNSMREQHRFLRGMVSWVGYKTKPYYYDRDVRHAGETKYPFSKMLKFALDALFSFSNIPLKLSNYMGVVIVSLGLVGILFILVQGFFFGNFISGVSSTLLAVLLIGGVQLISLGIIGEYLGRIFDQIKGRPLYLIDELINFDSNHSGNKE